MAGLNITEENATFDLGAKRCMVALQAMEKISEASGPEFEQCWLADDAAVNVLLSASEANSPFMRGFLSVIGEYVNMCNAGGLPSLDGHWTPKAMMTKERLTAHRADMVARALD